jgi:hypothetical protein
MVDLDTVVMDMAKFHDVISQGGMQSYEMWCCLRQIETGAQ